MMFKYIFDFILKLLCFKYCLCHKKMHILVYPCDFCDPEVLPVFTFLREHLNVFMLRKTRFRFQNYRPIRWEKALPFVFALFHRITVWFSDFVAYSGGFKQKDSVGEI